MGHNPDEVVEVFQCAAEENQISSLRQQQVVHLPAEGEVFIAGDLHDHRRNLDKLLFAVDLANHPERHLVLQEVVHGHHWDETGAEGSWETLFKIADLKCRFASQVHFLMANHDLAQIHGEGIMKNGESVCKAFNKGVRRDFHDHTGPVQAAITEFLLSFPLAIRSSNGLLFTHSVPTDSEIPVFDYTAFDRPLTGPDYYRKTGPVYQLVWGRRTTPPFIAQFLDKMGAKFSVVGHQPQEFGYALNGDRQIIIASDNNQGVFLHASLSDPLDLDTLVRSITKFVAIDMPITDPEPIDSTGDDTVAAEVSRPAPSIPPPTGDEPEFGRKRYDLSD